MKDIMTRYLPPQSSNWSGRSDGLNDRFHEQIKCQDLSSPIAKDSIVFIGFSCDEGIRRNQGRVGAAKGPKAFRLALSSLPVFSNRPLVDIGDITCTDQNLESSQKALSSAVTDTLKSQAIPFIIGGGHELAIAQYMGVAYALQGKSIACVNFDAHYDLRPYDQTGPTSGTSFAQIADHCFANNLEFNYTCLGIQKLSNSKALHKQAFELGVNTIFADEFLPSNADLAINKIIASNMPILLTICLDVFSAALAPGVSSPEPLGLNAASCLQLIQKLVRSKNVVAVSLAELSPPFDRDEITAKLAARLASAIIEAYD